MSSRDIRRKETTRSLFRSSRGSSIKYSVLAQNDMHSVQTNVKDEDSKVDGNVGKGGKTSVSNDMYYVDVSKQMRIPHKVDSEDKPVPLTEMPMLVEEEACLQHESAFLPVMQYDWEQDVEWTDNCVQSVSGGKDTNTASSQFFVAPVATVGSGSVVEPVVARVADGIRKKVRNSVFSFIRKSNQRGQFAKRLITTEECMDDIVDRMERVTAAVSAPAASTIVGNVPLYVANPRALVEFQSRDTSTWQLKTAGRELTREQKYEQMNDLPLLKYFYENGGSSFLVQTSLGTQAGGEQSVAGVPTKQPTLLNERWEDFEHQPAICEQPFVDQSNGHTTGSFSDNDQRATRGSVQSNDGHYLLRPMPQFERSLHCLHARLQLPPWCSAALTVADAYHWHRPKLPLSALNASPIPSLIEFSAGANRSIGLLHPDTCQIPPASSGQPARVVQTLSSHGARHMISRSEDVLDVRDTLHKLENTSGASEHTVKALNELSASEGAVIQVEHCTALPLILQNIGMNSRITTYLRKRGTDDPKKHPTAVGASMVIGANDTQNQPLLQFPEIPSMTVLENQLYVHLLSKTAQPTVYCDFLLCNTALRRTEQPRWVLRTMPPVYVASNIIPKVVLPAPHSEEWETLKSRWANAIIQRYFSSESHTMDASIFTSYFGTAASFKYPGLSSHSPDGTVSPVRTDALHSIGVVAKWCKQHASTLIGGRDLMDMFNDNGVFQVNSIRNMTEERLQSLCSPEDTCIVQAVAMASVRLQLGGLSLYRTLDDRASGRPVLKGASMEQARTALLKNNKEMVVQEATKAAVLRNKLRLINATQHPGFAQVTAWIVRALRRTPWYVSGAVHGYLRQQRFFFDLLSQAGRSGCKIQLPSLDLIARLRDEKKRVSTTSRGTLQKGSAKKCGDSFASKFSALGKKDVNAVLASCGFSHSEQLQQSAAERRRVAIVVHAISEVCYVSTSEVASRRAAGATGTGKSSRVSNDLNWARETQKQNDFVSSIEVPPAVSRSVQLQNGGSSAKLDVSVPMYESIVEEEDKQINGLPRGKDQVVFCSEEPEIVTKILPLFSPYGSEDYAEVRGVVPVPYYAPATAQVVKRVRSRVHSSGKKVVYVDYILDKEAVNRFKASVDNPKEFIPPYEIGCASLIHDGKIYTALGGVSANVRKIGRKRKHTEEDDDAYEPSSYAGKSGSTVSTTGAGVANIYRRVKDPLTLFSSMLLEAMAHIERLPSEVLHAFSKPVDKKRVPGYYSIVQSPMDLQTINQRIKNLHYYSSQQFKDDLMLIYTNSVLFNSDASDLTRFAAMIVEEGSKYLASQSAIMAPVELEATKFKTQALMNQALLQIVNEISATEQAKPFLFKPSEKFAANYDKIIQRPMWLVFMKDRCNAHAYGTLRQFLDDAELIKENCFRFNTQPDHYLHAIVTQLHDTIVSRVQALPHTFQDFIGVSAVEDPKGKPKKSSKASTTKKQREQASEATSASFARAISANKSVKLDQAQAMDDDDDLFDD